jgi:hypothetical protein
MDLLVDLSGINYYAVFVSALSALVIGWFWYGPLFGNTWMKLNGFTEEELKEGKISLSLMMLLNYMATILAAFAIALFIGAKSNAGIGMFTGVMIALFWISTNRLNDVLYERKPWKLYILNLGYNLIIYAVMGAIIGAWR